MTSSDPFVRPGDTGSVLIRSFAAVVLIVSICLSRSTLAQSLSEVRQAEFEKVRTFVSQSTEGVRQFSFIRFNRGEPALRTGQTTLSRISCSPNKEPVFELSMNNVSRTKGSLVQITLPDGYAAMGPNWRRGMPIGRKLRDDQYIRVVIKASKGGGLDDLPPGIYLHDAATSHDYNNDTIIDRWALLVAREKKFSDIKNFVEGFSLPINYRINEHIRILCSSDSMKAASEAIQDFDLNTALNQISTPDSH